ncbi:MAG: hypothetical protein KKD28_09735, partial [Chloroflexi bacterium]|nr:hypothetical protein [Chloroflexota bacterium]
MLSISAASVQHDYFCQDTEGNLFGCLGVDAKPYQRAIWKIALQLLRMLSISAASVQHDYFC